jgi:hypothetical protein
MSCFKDLLEHLARDTESFMIFVVEPKEFGLRVSAEGFEGSRRARWISLCVTVELIELSVNLAERLISGQFSGDCFEDIWMHVKR